MKKFLSFIPTDTTNNSVHYFIQEGNTLLENDIETHFPIMILIRNNVVSGEIIAVNIIVTDNHKCVEANRQLFIEELEKAKNDIGFDYELTEIHTSMEEISINQLTLFVKIIQKIYENDELYVDITYGTKPTPTIITMVLNHYDLYNNYSLYKTPIKAIIYGTMDYAVYTTETYNLIWLLHKNSVIQMPMIRHVDPLFIKNVISR